MEHMPLLDVELRLGVFAALAKRRVSWNSHWERVSVNGRASSLAVCYRIDPHYCGARAAFLCGWLLGSQAGSSVTLRPPKELA
jgi:hypothetical protein